MTSNKTKAPSEPLYKAMIAAGVDYRPWESQGLDDDECFVCTKTIGDGERTTECQRRPKTDPLATDEN